MLLEWATLVSFHLVFFRQIKSQALGILVALGRGGGLNNLRHVSYFRGGKWVGSRGQFIFLWLNIIISTLYKSRDRECGYWILLEKRTLMVIRHDEVTV